MTGPRLFRLGALALAALCADPGRLGSQEAAAPPGEQAATAEPAGRPPLDRAAEKARREDVLRSLEGRLRENDATRRRLREEVSALAADKEKLTAALIEAAAAVRAAEDRIAGSEARLDGLAGREGTLRASLSSRRGALAAVIGALGRIGRNPPPALLTHPADIGDALKAAILLEGALPGMRFELRRLAADLVDLSALRTALAAERGVFEAEAARLAGERDRLGELVLARQARLAAAEAELGGERVRRDRLGREAGTLKELIDGLDAEIAAARRAEDAAREAAEAENRQVRERFAAAAGREPIRLSARTAFPGRDGSLLRPASGATLRAFGAPDGSGGTLKGITVSTRPRATVIAAAEGTVVFSGPFRSYGRLLIISLGGGYHLLLAGMERVSVGVGQVVLAGEPVGEMGDAAAPAAALGVVEADGPVLYVEFRKDGGPVDPGPFWAKTQGERARG